MIAPNINGQARPFAKPVTKVYVAENAAGDPVMPGFVTEPGQWSAWEAGHETLEGFVDKAGTIYDPLLQAWILEPVYYYADHWILESYDHENNETVTLPRPSTEDGGFYGWHVLAGGQAVYEGDYANLTHLVSGLPYGTWVNTEASEDLGFRALRQQAPVALWAAMTEPNYPLPGDPSFEVMLRMDDLQASGSGAVPDPETAYVQFVFGGGRWRIVVRPDPKHILGAVAERKIRWQVSLWERSSTSQSGWTQRLGQEDGMDALKIDSDGYVHICVQCIDGCIAVRPDALSEDGAVYVRRTHEGRRSRSTWRRAPWWSWGGT
ncbi:MAG: hypothetical protein GF320_02480 [Armatimonadia bacterium]|nr:hypothetical protein [Armatimonadia bacterium]